MSSIQSNPKRRIEKPIGIYIITAFDFLTIGLIPLLLIVSLSRSQDFELPFINIVLSVSLAVLIMAASVWAWFRDNPGRYLLLSLVTINSLLLIINNILLLFNSEVAASQTSISVGYIIRGSFWIVINWWYFTRQSTVAYYKQNTLS